MSKIAWRKAPETFHLGCLLPSYQPSAKTQSTANHLRGWCCWNYRRSSAAPAMLSKNLSHAILKDDLLVICPTVCHRFCIFQVLWMGPSTAITGHDLPALAPPQTHRCPDGWRSNIEREWNGLISCIYKSWWNFSSSRNTNNTIISILNIPESPSTTRIFIHYHHQLNWQLPQLFDKTNWRAPRSWSSSYPSSRCCQFHQDPGAQGWFKLQHSTSDTPSPLFWKPPIHTVLLGARHRNRNSNGKFGGFTIFSIRRFRHLFHHFLRLENWWISSTFWQKKWHKWRRSGWNRNLRSKQIHDILSG